MNQFYTLDDIVDDSGSNNNSITFEQLKNRNHCFLENKCVKIDSKKIHVLKICRVS